MRGRAIRDNECVDGYGLRRGRSLPTPGVLDSGESSYGRVAHQHGHFGSLLALLLTVTCVSPGQADQLLISGSKKDEARLLFVNYIRPDLPFIQDLGMKRGGLDSGCSLADDKAAVLLQRPNAYDARSLRPTILACGIGAAAGRPLKVEISLVLGSYFRRTGEVAVFWNGDCITNLDARHDRVREMGPQRIQDYGVDIPGTRVLPQNVLALMPISFRGDVAMVDAIRISGDNGPHLLSRQTARGLLSETSLYERRSLSGKGRVLLIDRMRLAFGLMEYEVLGALHADVDVYPPPDKPGLTWVRPSEWAKYRVVILRTVHKLTPADNTTIRRYLESGGLLIVSPGTLNGFFVQNRELKPEQAGWTGGFLGQGVKLPDISDVTYALKAGVYTLGDTPPAKPTSWTAGKDGLATFRVPSQVNREEIRVTFSPAGQDYAYPALYFHRVGRGAVVGTALPIHVTMVQLIRDIVVSAFGRPLHRYSPLDEFEAPQR